MTAAPAVIAPTGSASPSASPPVSAGGDGAVGWVDEVVIGAVACGAWIGAAMAPMLTRSAAVALIGAGLATIGLLVRPTAAWRGGRALAGLCLVIGIVLLSGHRARAVADEYRPLPTGPLPSPVEVIGDPEPVGVAGWRVEIALPNGHRVEAAAFGRAGVTISRVRLGQSLDVDGRLLDLGDRPWLRTRHIVARASIAEAEVIAEPGWIRSFVEAVRDRVRAGGDSLAARPKALYHGLLLGDDRFQTPGQTLRFRLSGLSHLLAVSGQNVAFVLAALAPVTGRLGPRRRLAALLVILVVFALITRLEPSVLRAVTTSGLSAWAAVSGRSRSGLGVLAAAVTALILVDPFLVDSVGFQLSVAASGGILLLSPTLIRRLPGPGWFARPLATSLGAQIGVAPLLSHYFGPVSIVAIPANLAAGWAAAATMIWGMSIGPIAGLAPDGAAALIQSPVRLLLWWLETVAALGARAPDPRPDLAVIGALIVVGVAARSLTARSLAGRPAGVRWPTGLVSVIVLVVLAASVPRAPEHPAPCGRDLWWYPPAAAAATTAAGGRSVLVVGPLAGPDSVERCRRAGVRAADLVVVEVGDRRTGRTVGALREVMTVGQIRAPAKHWIVGARRQLVAVEVAVVGGRLVIEPDASGRRLMTGMAPWLVTTSIDRAGPEPNRPAAG